MARRWNSFFLGLSSATASLFMSKNPEHGHWEAYKGMMSLHFDQQEEMMRAQIFKTNVDFVNQHNSKQMFFTVALNRFSHMV